MTRRRSGKKIDFVHWTLGVAESFGQSAGVIGVTLAAALHEPETLLRCRGNLACYLDGGPTTGGQVKMGVGLILVPEGTGSTVLWSPITDGDAPWIWVDIFRVAYEEMVTDVIAAQQLIAHRSVIDGKAMRISRNQELQVVFENVTAQGALTTNTAVDLRTLAGK